MNPLDDLTASFRGWAEIIAGRPGAARYFRTTTLALLLALLTLAIAVLFSVAAQSVVLGLPATAQVVYGLIAQGIIVALLGVAIRQSLRFLGIRLQLNTLLVPIVYAMAYVFVLSVPLTLIGPDTGLIAILALGLLIFRAARVLAGMQTGVAIALAALCVLVLVAVPAALYMLLLAVPT